MIPLFNIELRRVNVLIVSLVGLAIPCPRSDGHD